MHELFSEVHQMTISVALGANVQNHQQTNPGHPSTLDMNTDSFVGVPRSCVSSRNCLSNPSVEGACFSSRAAKASKMPCEPGTAFPCKDHTCFVYRRRSALIPQIKERGREFALFSCIITGYAGYAGYAGEQESRRANDGRQERR